MFIVKHRRIFFTISIVLVLAALASIFVYGLRPGTDFSGGSIYKVSYVGTRPDANVLRAEIDKLNLGSVTVQPVGDKDVVIKSKSISQAEKQVLTSVLSASGTNPIVEKQFSSIGPTVGRELAQRGITAIILVVIVIIIFLAIAFRKVGHVVSSWKYGVAAIVALIHDVTIPSGIVAYLGHTQGFEVDALFLTALLTTLALSVNDTIVVFDRIRENVKNRVGATFEETVGLSLNQTIVRSLITSLTVIIVLLVLLFYGAESTHNFALVMVLGMFFGTYSSIFIASPLLLVLQKRQAEKKK